MTEQFLRVYNLMLERYGPQNWWPGETRFEMMVGAILTQAAAWTNVENTILSLKAADLLSPQAIRSVSQEELARHIYSSGYFNSKARKLKAFADFLGERFHDDLDAMSLEDAEALRLELLGVYGVGEETADDILLYALEKPTFVIDNYTRRIFHRLGLAPKNGSYSAYRTVFMAHLPLDRDLFGEYHALMVSHGKEVCKKNPLCQECCLLAMCPTGKVTVGTQQAK